MPTLPATCRVALKEWAVAARALDAGQTVLLLRKGGIREPDKEFRVLYEEFLLYPTFEHQRPELVKAPWRQALAETVAQAQGPHRVTFSHFVQVYRAYELLDQEALDLLGGSHIWTADYAQKRLHWKPRKPLAVMVVRVHRMKEPQTIPVLPEYIGCTSWVPLDRELPLGRLTPVLSEDAFLQKAQEVHRALGRVPVTL